MPGTSRIVAYQPGHESAGIIPPVPATRKQLNKAVEHIVAHDPAFAPIVDTSPPCSLGQGAQNDRDPFEALVQAVIAQQLSVKAADTITARVTSALNGTINAAAVNRTPVADFRSAGLSGAKTRTIKGLAEAVDAGVIDLGPTLQDQHDDQIVGTLTSLWGIGRWTVEMFLMFSLHRLDVWPTGDLAMRKGWHIIHGGSGDIDPREIEEAADSLSPYRSVAAWYCWRAVEGENSSW